MFAAEQQRHHFLIYVDDCAVAAPSDAEIDEVKEMLKQACELKSMGPVRDYLGFQIIRDRANKVLYLH